jgi:plastocyanin
MHRLRRLGLGSVLFLTAWSRPNDDQPVSIKVFQFDPKTIEVAVGTKVIWTNQDQIEHTITSGDGEKSDGKFSGVMAGKDQQFSFTFTQPGVYSYFCDRHHFMRGEVRVKP